ncbi:MAG: response regulator transcription factor [Candidatus Gastranaerophilales bacterium]|nr:response regulator transcription factor [Candidatus Gastranaerophilales bacterium]
MLNTETIRETSESTIKILLVEDHIMARMGTAMFIKSTEGFELLGQAEDGVQAIDLALRLKPDVILMDIGLPKIDGIEATRKIKGSGLDASILMLTSRESEEDVYAALSAGADGYIMKGSNLETLTSAIKSVNAKAGWLDPMIARIVLGNIQNGQNFCAQNNAGSSNGTKGENNVYGLTRKELEVLSLISDGLSNKEISKKLVVSISTTKAHVHNILQKLYLEDRTKAAIKALKEGLI